MRTLEDIVPPSRRKDDTLGRVALKDAPRPPRFPYVTVLVVVAIIAASVAALFYFSSAKVEITPSTATAAAQGSFTASKNSGDLPFELITAEEKVASQSVKSSGTKTVSATAAGTVTLYNTQSKPQTLVATTRLATPAGLIFRIRSAVTIPAGSQAKPGSITTSVSADKPGDSYNVGPTSFTIPGLSGTPQEGKVYARSAAMMTGGASGSVPLVDSAVESSARAALQGALAPELTQGLEAKVPAGYILLPGAFALAYSELPATPSESGTADIKVQGTASAVIFPAAALARAIARAAPGLNYEGEGITIEAAGDLALSAAGGLPGADAESFTFTLTGTAPLVYTVDPARIAAAVAGKTRSEAKVALNSYPEVNRAFIVLRPFWRQTFPEDPASIRVEVDTP